MNIGTVRAQAPHLPPSRPSVQNSPDWRRERWQDQHCEPLHESFSGSVSPMIGVSTVNITFRVQKGTLELSIWNTAGQE
jgi:hypothetical protein